MNVHGDMGDERGIKETSELFPAISMMNHARNPNCGFLLPVKEDTPVVAVIGTLRDVKKGDELLMKYHDDDTVARKWGISC